MYTRNRDEIVVIISLLNGLCLLYCHQKFVGNVYSSNDREQTIFLSTHFMGSFPCCLAANININVNLIKHKLLFCLFTYFI